MPEIVHTIRGRRYDRVQRLELAFLDSPVWLTTNMENGTGYGWWHDGVAEAMRVELRRVVPARRNGKTIGARRMDERS